MFKTAKAWAPGLMFGPDGGRVSRREGFDKPIGETSSRGGSGQCQRDFGRPLRRGGELVLGGREAHLRFGGRTADGFMVRANEPTRTRGPDPGRHCDFRGRGKLRGGQDPRRFGSRSISPGAPKAGRRRRSWLSSMNTARTKGGIGRNRFDRVIFHFQRAIKTCFTQYPGCAQALSK